MCLFIRNCLKVLVVFGVLMSSYGQINSEIQYYNYFDEQVGVENTGLYQGVIHTEKYRTINELTQYFKTKDFLPGSICYEGQCYYNLNLKYDIYEDQVLLKLINRAGGWTLKLFKDKVECFKIQDHDFILLQQQEAPGLNAYGFYEIAYRGACFTLHTKHTKQNFARTDQKSLYHEFPNGASEHVLMYNGAYYTVNSKKDQIAVFPEFKKQIIKFYNLARRLRKSDPHGFQVSLMQHIELLLSKSKNNCK